MVRLHVIILILQVGKRIAESELNCPPSEDQFASRAFSRQYLLKKKCQALCNRGDPACPFCSGWEEQGQHFTIQMEHSAMGP